MERTDRIICIHFLSSTKSSSHWRLFYFKHFPKQHSNWKRCKRFSLQSNAQNGRSHPREKMADRLWNNRRSNNRPKSSTIWEVSDQRSYQTVWFYDRFQNKIILSSQILSGQTEISPGKSNHYLMGHCELIVVVHKIPEETD